MFPILLFLHSLIRWLVLLTIIPAIIIGWKGSRGSMRFTSGHNALRHWTATVAHIQLMIGIIIWSQSPWVKAFMRTKFQSSQESVFFGLIHITGMLVAIVILTIGSAKAKREKTDTKRFKTMATWFTIALIIILISIPWPFSPLSVRPLFRSL